MSSISAFEAKTRFGELLDRVVAGEEIIITRHEKPIARMIPEGKPRRGDVERAVSGLKALQKEIAKHYGAKGKIPWNEFKRYVEEGRR